MHDIGAEMTGAYTPLLYAPYYAPSAPILSSIALLCRPLLPSFQIIFHRYNSKQAIQQLSNFFVVNMPKRFFFISETLRQVYFLFELINISSLKKKWKERKCVKIFISNQNNYKNACSIKCLFNKPSQTKILYLILQMETNLQEIIFITLGCFSCNHQNVIKNNILLKEPLIW